LKNKQARDQHEGWDGSACCLLQAGFLIGLFFVFEDLGGVTPETSVSFHLITLC
jgi:hypothetical protein